MEKCAVMLVKQGRMAESEAIQLSESINLRALFITDTYKYLDVLQVLSINECDMKQSLQDLFLGAQKKVLPGYSYLFVWWQ